MTALRHTNLSKGWAVEAIVFCLALVVYILSLRPGVGLWDAGEFVCSGSCLDVGHPPGAPLYWLIMRLATMFVPASCEAIACNVTTAVSCAIAAALLCRCVRGLMRLFIGTTDVGSAVAGFTAGTVWAFSMSVWGVAVETEVYGAAMAFGLLMVWCALQWRMSGEFRWVALLCLVAGLSSGVHWLSWLMLPVAGVVMGSAWRSRVAMVVGMILGGVAVVMFVIMASGWVYEAAAILDVIGVNIIGLGVGVMWGVTTLLVMLLFLYVAWRYAGALHRVALCAFLLILGFSVYIVPMMRSGGGVALAVSSPSDPCRLVDYMARRQYGDRPLFYGPAYSSKPNGVESDIRTRYDEKSGKYEAIDVPINYTYPDDQQMLFPRMQEQDPAAQWAYHVWAMPDGWPDEMPTQGANMRFLVRYQLGQMMMRYVLWNFCGRQNDIIGDGGCASGNAITGIPFVDNHTLGLVEYDAPSHGRVALYGIPLILCIVGLCLLTARGKRRLLFIVGVWVIVAGPALAIFLNMPPYEPRERDYVYLPLYAALAVAVGCSVWWLCSLVGKTSISQKAKGIAMACMSFVMPSFLIAQTWQSATRAGNTIPDALATTILNLCPPDAMILTGGDNDTYPLWYAQEVLGIRRDVRVVNYTLLSSPWHLEMLTRAGRGDAALNIAHADIALKGQLQDVFILPDGHDTLRLDDMRQITLTNGLSSFYLPTNHIALPIGDTMAVITPMGDHLSPNALMLLEILDSNKNRPLCIMPGALTDSLGLEPYLRDAGPLAYLSVDTTALDIRQIFKAVTLPDAESFNPTDDEVQQLARLRVRHLCLSAARSYEAAGDRRSALSALRTSLSWLPATAMPDDTTLITIAKELCRLGDAQLCRTTLSTIADHCSLRLRWAANLCQRAPIAAVRMRDDITPLTQLTIEALAQTGNSDVSTALTDIVQSTTLTTTP